MRLLLADLRLRSRRLARELAAVRRTAPPPEGVWYAYDVFGNLKRLWRMLGPCFDFGPMVERGIYDIGAADGDLSFLFESYGVDVAALDNPGTNCNRMTGIRALAAARSSRVAIHAFDVDALQPLPAGERSLAVFLGTLYHVKNPLGVLERIRDAAEWCLLSTRIAQTSTDGTCRLEGQPLAYLLRADECNRDATNYWIFGFQGLLRLCERAGWRVAHSLRHGGAHGSDPAVRDERTWLLLHRA